MVHDQTTPQNELQMLQTAVDGMDRVRFDKADVMSSEDIIKRKMADARAAISARVKSFATFERGYN